ncbi:SNF2 domain-containing protein CLASSY 1-like [Humulus lupulus]|uniref:SNF2 domain-containing protein CLASSY 1-like n=1 Tax=Humulus lupulus TaxID=3486 RepID=UPI002B400F42|nr:SNF2 domain-containing protein CLASSY 1-like [Humulus lupulus]XP_062092379.1 SNF2 domain-containing protein CLASSY 1-like [Humulus lupulus]XP_062092380.1 SNF2 domain-containing protein CLASSY 1-like [Humulus lupulus]XP_062092381.1 SNF2 domain-containing protein CLASSY 1-like [Humulus lupulus]XP_062092382.1 SNF2 domain-containing protein CLASSY 1-like [Humulus lupulus]
MVTKKHFCGSYHPYNDQPFEALCCGSWKALKSIRISNGTMRLNFMDHGCTLQEKGPFTNLRIKSRQATLSDCTCFLRPGVDICVLSTLQSDDEGQDPVWIDARISSIERKPHESGCSCKFYINFYTNQGPLGSVTETLNKEITVVEIDKIFILQKIGQNFCEDQYYRWDFSKDCSTRQKTKMLLGKILSDLSWLLVTSSVKNISFDVRSVQSKIVYQILGVVEESSSSSSHSTLHAANFRVDNGISVPIVVQFAQDDSIRAEPNPTLDKIEAEPSPFSDSMGLRRSKRRNVQPERFLGCDSGSEIDVGYVRTRPYKIDRGEDIELSMPLSLLFGVNGLRSKAHSRDENISHPRKRNFSGNLIEYESKATSRKVKPGVTNRKEHPYKPDVPLTEKEIASLSFDNYQFQAKNPRNHAKKLDEISPQRYYANNYHKVQKKNISDLEELELESTWERRPVAKSAQKRRYRRNIRYNSFSGERTYQKRSLHAGAYTELINSFLKNIDCTGKEEPQITDQWKEHKTTNLQNEMPPDEDEEEMSETEILWKEMELALASSYVLDDDEDSNVGGASEKFSNPECEHEYKVDEEVGILCSLCGSVFTEIRDILPPFMQNTGWSAADKNFSEEDLERGAAEDSEMDFLRPQGCPDEPLSEKNENVWALIPEIRRKLHLHQKKAFEFLWKNIAGSLTPDLIKPKSNKLGGCVISHSPGAGKTFLMIAFLVSYLKLFPGKRPLILAPKTTLYTWYKEFIKWKIPVPVYLIHGRRTYRVFRQKSIIFPGAPRPTDDVRHILDCLEKIQKWHAHPSVLVMGYTSFLALMREDSKFAHRKFMAKVLRESPGILILDEGHNPRSTKSRLRKALMKVETDLRILLSGTLFQNNFCEYFNTLCLARPKFVNEVLKVLDPKYKKKKKKLVEKARNLMEARARKFFLDNIAKKIDSNEEKERMQGLKMLRKITTGFIDVYEGGGSSDTLPGLQIYTLLMNSTDKQHEILVKLHQIMSTYHGYPLELELLITLGSIHPWLIKTAVCANKFFSDEELQDLERYKFDLKKGSKVKFVLNLVYRVVKKEKILLFCHNIAPVKLFLELFEQVFGWQRGKEVLVLTGDLELFERGRVMDKFEEPAGESKVLLASITACAEGISLTAASRVIMLDSEWNPSKTKQAIARAFRPGQQKVVYVYQLLATGTLEEDKYRRTTWKEWVSSMIFSEALVEDPSKWQAEKLEDDILREMVEEDRTKSFHMIMKNEKASTVIRGKD